MVFYRCRPKLTNLYPLSEARMTPVSPSLALPLSSHAASVQASDTSYALNTLAEMFDWSKGAAQKNSARITATNLPKLEAATKEKVHQREDIASMKEVSEPPADIFTRVSQLLEAASNNPSRVPALLARQAKQLNAFEFAKLMSTAEETGSNWGESERYFVFVYPSGSVGSVWLGGVEVYNSIWKNI